MLSSEDWTDSGLTLRTLLVQGHLIFSALVSHFQISRELAKYLSMATDRLFFFFEANEALLWRFNVHDVTVKQIEIVFPKRKANYVLRLRIILIFNLDSNRESLLSDCKFGVL